MVTSQTENLTLTIRYNQLASPKAREICLYGHKSGHFADRSPKNPHQNTFCGKCGRYEYQETNFWSTNRRQNGIPEARVESRPKLKLFKCGQEKGPVNAGAVSVSRESKQVIVTKRDAEGNLL